MCGPAINTSSRASLVSNSCRVAAAATRRELLLKLAREDVVIAGPHMNFPGLGRLRKEGSRYSWAPVVFTDQWDRPVPSPPK